MVEKAAARPLGAFIRACDLRSNLPLASNELVMSCASWNRAFICVRGCSMAEKANTIGVQKRRHDPSSFSRTKEDCIETFIFYFAIFCDAAGNCPCARRAAIME